MNSNKEIFSKIEMHELWLQTDGVEGEQAVLRSRDLSNLKLDNVNLSFAILQNCRFIRSSLIGANFNGADIRGVDFSYALLGGSNLENCMATGAVFEGAKIQNSKCADGNFAKCRFDYAVLNMTDFSNATLESVSFYSSNLLNANLQTALMSDIVFTNSVMAGTKFPPNSHYTDFEIDRSDQNDVSELYLKTMQRFQKRDSKIHQLLFFIINYFMLPLGLILIGLSVFYLLFNIRLVDFFKDETQFAIVTAGGMIILLSLVVLIFVFIARKLRMSYLPNLVMNYESKIRDDEVKGAEGG